MSNHTEATFFAQLEPEWSLYRNNDGDLMLTGAKVARITQRQPDPPRGGTVVVKLTVRVPSDAFLPLRPPAVEVEPEYLQAELLVEAPTPDGLCEGCN